MCGISAVVAHGSAGPPVGPMLLKAHAALAHRGPDGEAFLAVGRDGRASRLDRWPSPGDPSSNPALAIGFHHLKVQDLSDASRQPLQSADGLHWIVFNGEIYNANELRMTLRQSGHSFRTRTDTEVLLAAYLEWGTDCFQRLDGMWAVLIVDLVRRALIGSRDRLGIKPLYYAIEENRFILASEPQAVVRARLEPPAIQPDRLYEFLLGLPPQTTGATFFDGVQLVPAASVFEVDFLAQRPAEPSFQRFWDLRDHVASQGTAPSFDEACAEVRTRFESAIALHAEAAVPVGCLLSGGLDASFVARTLANRAHARGEPSVAAYSIVFNEPDMSELPFIWSVVRQGGLRSHTCQLTPRQAWEDVDTVVCAQGQPLLGQDLIAQYHAYRLAREHGCVVVLEGQGADELLAGMPSYASVMFQELLGRRKLGTLAAELWAHSRARGLPRLDAANELARWIARTTIGPRRRPPVPDWIEGDALSCGRAQDGWTPSRDPSLLNQHLFRLVTRTNLPTVLQVQDRSAMVHGIESRVPFLDHRFVEYCFTLPPEYKVGHGQRKRVLVAAAHGIVPDAVLQRRDKKTFISRTNWMPLREAHAGALREMASSSVMQRAPWLRPRRVTAFVDDFLRGRHDDVLAIWRLYTCWRWMELFGMRP
jgi:asparagine synthase (glutamine-hydrolysing)